MYNARNSNGINVENLKSAGKLFLALAIIYGILGIYNLNMLYNNPQLATAEDMALMVRETMNTLYIIALAVIVSVTALRYKKTALFGAILVLAVSVGYGIYCAMARQTFDVGVWLSAFVMVAVIIITMSETSFTRSLRPCPPTAGNIRGKGASG